MFESDNAEGETAITVKLPKYDRIGKISVKVVKELAQGIDEETEEKTEHDKYHYASAIIQGLLIEDEKGNELFNVTWYKESMEGKWIDYVIPEDQVICGFATSGQKYDKFITRLGFQLATRKSDTKEPKRMVKTLKQTITFGD